MRELTENHKKLTYYLKDIGVTEEEMLAICLLCRTDEQAKKMLEYCEVQEKFEFSNILEKAVEIYSK